MDSHQSTGEALLVACRFRMLGECVPRIVQCLGELDEEGIWFRPNAETVSVGNLVLHLCGNVRQHVIAGLGGASDVRERDAEFSEAGPIATAELLAIFHATMKEVGEVFGRLDPESLTAPLRIQGCEETAVSTLLHVVEHFSYHTGQITFAVKSRMGVDLGYYAGRDLNLRNED